MKDKKVLNSNMQAAILGLFLGITAESDQAAKSAFKEVTVVTSALSDEELDVCKAVANLYTSDLKTKFFASAYTRKRGRTASRSLAM